MTIFQTTVVGWAKRPRKKFDDIFIRFDTIPECDRQQDGQVVTAIAVLCYVLCEQKSITQLIILHVIGNFTV